MTMNTGLNTISKRIKYLKDNWKLVIHLLFRTYYFGVDNERKARTPSIFGKPMNERWKVVRHYKEMRMRAFMGFIPNVDACMLFPFHAKKNGYKS